MEVKMTRKALLIGAAATAAVIAAGAYGTAATAQSGWGMMGGGYGPGWMHRDGYGPGRGGGDDGYGPGWMHRDGYGPRQRGGNDGYGPGWMHRGGYGPGEDCPWATGSYGRQGNLNLTVDDVKTRLERWLEARDNPRLKVGEVKEKDADTIVADVVTKDNSLVNRFTVNRRTGVYSPDRE
jgi:hypothetical protein